LGEKTAVSMGGIVKIARFGLGLARDDTNKKKSASPASKALLSRGRTIATRSIEHMVGEHTKSDDCFGSRHHADIARVIGRPQPSATIRCPQTSRSA